MAVIFFFFGIFCFFCLIIGLLDPRLVIKWGSQKTRKKVWLIYGLAGFGFFLLAAAFSFIFEINDFNDFSVEDSSSKPQSCLVTKVVDGDTFEVLTAGTTRTVRLLGVDTPEVYQENRLGEYQSVSDLDCLKDWGVRASEFTEDYLEDRKIFISFDYLTGRTGDYGRLLGYLEVDGRDFGKILLEKGFARVYSEENFQKKQTYLLIQEKAQTEQVGLWSCR